MQKSGGFIALLLIIAIIFTPVRSCSPANGQETVSPRTVYGDTAAQSDTAPHEDNENESAKIIAVVVIVIIVIFIISCITDTENNQHGQEVKAGWK